VVQDISELMFTETRKKSDVADLLARVTFSRHDFFTAQPVQDVDAYLLRSCLHNWGDADCVRMLQAFVPAMEANRAALLINESVIPGTCGGGALPLHVERKLRSVDVAMFVIANAKQRTERDFRDLLAAADSRFKVSVVFLL
jgi:O-methyltransferase domain